MSARTANSFFASAALHALLMALVLWFTWAHNRSNEKEALPIFELVAGEGDNYAATEAPALGVAGGIKLEIPEPPAPSPSPIESASTPEPESSPVTAAAEPTPPVKPAPSKPATTPVKEYKPVNMAKMVDRIADKRAANIEKKIKADQDKAAKAEAAANAKKMSKAEFDRLNKNKSLAAQKPGTSGTGTSLKKIDTEGIAGGVVGGSTANKTGGAGGKALTRQDVELNDAYISLLIQRLKQAHQKPEGLSDLLEATVKFRLTASGAVVNVVILSSSRNSEYDQSVLAAFRRISLPPPPSNLKTSDYSLTFKMREDP
ncbi:MAG: TonB family protein [Opitutaceae bacterium]|nr:TonB family protein [Opitutaceae bacterium]